MRSASVASLALIVCVGGCLPATPSGNPISMAPATVPSSSTVPAASAPPQRIEHDGTLPVVVGDPIEIADLSGRIVTDDFEDVFAMDVDGSNVVTIAGDRAGSEFDAAWSPDGEWVVYRDSTRGINNDDEVFIARADGSERRNLTDDPANDWGPDWSADGSTIVFNSDRDGSRLRGYLVHPDGSNLRIIDVDAWVEYASFSPDGKRIAFTGAVGNDYELYVGDLESGAVEQLTDSPGHDSWPAWSPDGTTIAFSSHRDDCRVVRDTPECWREEAPDDTHHDIWLIEPDGSNLRRVTPEFGQFVAWSPDSQYLLISGFALYVVRLDGTGRVELRAEGKPSALGGIPDWR
jgi:Tol biopolymer transport system component